MASDLALHCLPMSLLWDTGHKWVKEGGSSFGEVFFFIIIFFFFFYILRGKNEF